MPKKFIVVSEIKYTMFKVLEAESEDEVVSLVESQDFEANVPEYQRYEGETVLTVSEAPEGYDLHDDAISKGFC